ncbi:MAG TPA: zinc ribbon domain-containing protein [Nitrospirae bacterium]|nr:zinc ribbon domain-containing protein [Nitrospirota bacterium]HDK17724.1 zinc ribbon domain-containing protein [Nitrospirota bacterium]
MPIYEYICLKCNEKFALLQSMCSADNNTECPKCSSREVKKAISSFSCATGSKDSASSSAPAPGFGGGG